MFADPLHTMSHYNLTFKLSVILLKSNIFLLTRFLIRLEVILRIININIEESKCFLINQICIYSNFYFNVNQMCSYPNFIFYHQSNMHLFELNISQLKFCYSDLITYFLSKIAKRPRNQSIWMTKWLSIRCQSAGIFEAMTQPPKWINSNSKWVGMQILVTLENLISASTIQLLEFSDCGRGLIYSC